MPSLCVSRRWINVGQSPPTKHPDAVSLRRYGCQLLFQILVTVFSAMLTFHFDIFKKAKNYMELILQKLAVVVLFVLLAILL